jgi:outer membrane protein assembly factor BamB
MDQPGLTPAVHAGSLARTSEFQTAGVHASPTVQWTFTPPSHEIPRTSISTPVLVDQEVAFPGCSDGRLYALDTHDGAIRWTFATHDSDLDQEDVLAGDEIHPEVTGLCLNVAGGYAYAGSEAGVLSEVDLATGVERCRWILRDLLTDVELDEAYIGALTLADDRLVFAIGGGLSQIFVVLDRRTGALSKMDSSPAPSASKRSPCMRGWQSCSPPPTIREN